MPKEKNIQNYILKNLNNIINSEWEKPYKTDAGLPDIRGHIYGYYIAIEVKKDNNNEPTKLQKYRIKRTNEKGAYAFWTSSWKDTFDKLNKYSRTKNFQIKFFTYIRSRRFCI